MPDVSPESYSCMSDCVAESKVEAATEEVLAARFVLDSPSIPTANRDQGHDRIRKAVVYLQTWAVHLGTYTRSLQECFWPNGLGSEEDF